MGVGNITGSSSQQVFPAKTKSIMIDQSTGTGFEPEAVALSPSTSKSDRPDEVGEKAKETLEKAHSASETAEKSGIKLKKREFFKTLAVAIGSGVLLGAGFIATLATGGAATPLLLLAATNMTVAVGDAVCAYKDWHGTNKNLPMGSDSVGNVMYAVLKRAGVDSDKSLKIADRVSMFGRGIFALTTISSSQKLSHSVSNFATNLATDFKIANKKQQTLATNFTSVRMSELPKDEDVTSDFPLETDDNKDVDTLGLERSKDDKKQSLVEVERMIIENKVSYGKSDKHLETKRSDWRRRYEESVSYAPNTNTLSFSGDIENQPTAKSSKQSDLESTLEHKQYMLKEAGQTEDKLVAKRGKSLLKSKFLSKVENVTNKKGVQSYQIRVADSADIVSFLTNNKDSEFTVIQELTENLKAEIKQCKESLKTVKRDGQQELSGLAQLYQLTDTKKESASIDG